MISLVDDNQWSTVPECAGDMVEATLSRSKVAYDIR